MKEEASEFQMKTQLYWVDNEQAKEWLENNTGNRRVRKSWVKALRTRFDHGEWKAVHTGIAFTPEGRLIDGQHRLEMIKGLPDGKKALLNVSVNVDESTYTAIDDGVKKTHADLLDEPQKLVSVAVFLHGLWSAAPTTGKSPARTLDFINLIRDTYEFVVEGNSAGVQNWTKAAVQAAAVYTILTGGDESYVREVYSALCKKKLTLLPQLALSLWEQVVEGRTKGDDKFDLFIRCLAAFDKKKGASLKLSKKPTIEQRENVRVEVRQTLTEIYEKDVQTIVAKVHVKFKKPVFTKNTSAVVQPGIKV